MAEPTSTSVAGGLLMGLGVASALPIDGLALFGALLGAWIATSTRHDFKAWQRLVALILPTCVGYVASDAALALVPWLTTRPVSALVCALVVIPLCLKALAWVDTIDFGELVRRIRGGS
ncbi:Putative phage holin [Pseudomonas citronellolis]|uniref:Phage holin n=1 Tax=Pseudomonas citronellolis TaxID=53408 RepID=A0AAQ1KFJ3_9PSED|nr:putative holin [Pseudomonas citronellolis]MCP1605714.1 hypothetical protein [Pseudomonas citronellolis]MCP1656132.1 hypothetical protein [Pseudomonas citronellolis]MCP1722292.1 hypothetical protein [Pseudomonas citronellolis]MDN6874627.1 putative holin [Pseudomonas citronellolis]TGC21039.1 hypothetical protein CW310_31490 [Pseudomonas citronellolis]